MKKVYYIIGAALLVISACMIYLVIKGVSLRSEPIIKPSPVDAKYENITFGIVHRMFPSFQKADYVVWGLHSDQTSEEQTIFELLRNEHLNQLESEPQVLLWSEQTTADELKSCLKPCWIILDKEKANSLKSNSTLSKIQNILGSNYFSVTFLDFERDTPVPSVCETEKRLDATCFGPVAVREVRKYLKDSDIRYFFTRSYNEIDYFLFIEKVK